ncbi:MAG: C-GCAxxG-C-C family protein [Lachnospiraceae bacterium]|nr:C-GCAxxG-C-C family protein [Lachnospiraceae bacterium]
MNYKEYIWNKVHSLYYQYDMNCARTTLTCLSELYNFPVSEDVYTAAIGMHGAGGYRAQCGLIEGALMFIGLYFSAARMSEKKIASICYQYAREFEKAFGSLTCRELRPGGFSKNDSPHLCESITCQAIELAYLFIQDAEP